MALHNKPQTIGYCDEMPSVPAEDSTTIAETRRCVLLAGVHNGSADCVARIFRHLGVDQPATSDDFAKRLQTLNEAIIASAGLEEYSVEPLHDGWYRSLRHAEFHQRAVKLVRSEYSSSSLFVLKDSAIARLVPFWSSVLKACGIEPVVVDYYQDPASFAEGLAKSSGVGADAARAVWLARVLESEEASRAMVRAQLSQEALREDWGAVLSRLSDRLGIVWPAWSAQVRKAIVAELVDGDDAVAPASRKEPQADQLGHWAQAAQDVLWRWARDGEDERGRSRMDELRAHFEEAREFVGIALAAVAELGRELRCQKQAADDLLTRVASLQRMSDATEQAAQAQADEVASLQARLANLEAERDRLAAIPSADKSELAKVEAKWAEVFRSSRDSLEILREQNGVFQAAITRLTVESEALEERLGKARAELERLRVVEISQKAEAASARAEVARIRKEQDTSKKALDEARKSVAQMRKEAANREKSIEDLQNALLTRGATAGPASAISSTSDKISLSPKSLLRFLKPKTRKMMLRHRRLRQLIAASGMFDAAFYAARYPDVAEAREDLLDHFIRFGGAEGRHPSLSFNSKWYLTKNPDVAAAGLNPLVHYLEHGRDEGRRRRSLVDADEASAAIAAASAAPGPEQKTAKGPPAGLQAAPSELQAAWQPRTGGWKAMLSADFVRRPALVPLADLQRQEDAKLLAVGDQVIATLASYTPRAALERVALFSAMQGGNSGGMSVAGEQERAAAPHSLLASSGCGFELLADGWFNSETGLTLRLSSGFAGAARAFQADDEGQLHCIAETVLAGGDADCVELLSVDPLAPLLLVLAGLDGALVDCAVLPFPSLMRGGLHYGELAVLETAPGSVATLSEYSGMLALEWLGWAEGPDHYAIRQVEIDMRGATGTEAIFRPALLASIARRFGISVCALEGSWPEQRGQLVASLEAAESAKACAARDGATGSLVLPADTVPSIYALVARRMPHDLSLARLAIVDAATRRPLADVSLPFDERLARLQHAEMPAHAPYVTAPEERAAGLGGPLFPLAVRHYSALSWQADPLMPVSPDQELQTGIGLGVDKTISVLIDTGRHGDELANCLAALENQIGADKLEVILTGWPEGAPLPACELPLRALDGGDLTTSGRLNAAAEMSEAEQILVVAPNVLLSDPRTVALLSGIAGQTNAASVACGLVTELHDDEEATLHSAGYFPARVSLTGEPVFDFNQLDVARTMPAATFPVVANHARCVLYDAAIFRILGGYDAQRFPMAMQDLDFGFRVLAAGHANLCTTLVRAAVGEAAPSADFPDALAHRSVRPADWQSLLDRVTVIRDLRR